MECSRVPDGYHYFLLKLFPVFTPQLWETTKVHTSSAVCLKRDSDVLFDQEEIIISAADNCNRLQVRLRGVQAGIADKCGPHTCVCVCLLGAQWQDRLCSLPVRGEVLQDPVYMFVPAALCCGHRAGRWHRTGRTHCFSA